MYTTNEEGILNNYAIEPTVYFANYPSPEQQQRYLTQGAIGLFVIALTVLTALSVS